ncbi:lasso peptide biosynthesis PqqD family chaperone [Streptomyces acidicola]|uniref:Lasso peptide biosynthesis PqqD family chaperone n=1 Tax=Streptomyces acidicola TaxID=2596892 RepID=A0A5N8WKE6_9ACTN|nr:lasso peptide biosynthesis PqqD family chaperone [Streptomyces acidicola]MPY47729.1 lasso peptide biosynthesis PqqD family chaperone [Streptomyces acidicola]
MQLRKDVSLVDTDYGKVLLNGGTGEYWELNPTGGLILAALLEGSPAEEIIGTLCAEFEVDEDRATTDVAALLSALREARLVRA